MSTDDERELACGCLMRVVYRCKPHAAAHRREQPDTPEDIAPQDPVTVADIVPGRTIWRWTDVTARGRVIAWVPCHPEHSVTLDAGDGRHVVRCRSCGRTYDLELQGNVDEGYDAVWGLSDVGQLIETSTRNGSQR